MAAYYNEIDEYAAQWLRNLIQAGHIAPGDVDTRSIEDVTPNDIKGYTQCHFFAGIGVWPYALRRAGWPDDRPVWTGSCPCQPFSVAGKGNGFDDERHLWPAFHWLIEQRRPVRVFGEQVASKDGYAWLDLVQADLEGTGYTVGAVVAPAAGFGAPHQRHRMYWVADADDTGPQGREFRRDRTAERVTGPGGGMADTLQSRRTERRTGTGIGQATGGGIFSDLAHPEHSGRETRESAGCWPGATVPPGIISGLADSDGRDTGTEGLQRSGEHGQFAQDGSFAGGLADTEGERERTDESGRNSTVGQFMVGAEPGCYRGNDGPTRGFWSAADWIYCRDEKYRPVEPIVEQMVDGSTASLGRVCPSAIQEIEKEITHAIRHQADPGKTLFNLWQTLSAHAVQRGAGRLQGVHEAPILLAFMRQLTQQGWTFAKSLSGTSAEICEAELRSVRGDISATRSPHKRGLDELRPEQSTDLMRLLSSILARYAQAAWGEAFDKNAAATNPLIVGGISRVGRLRAYGNAIVAPQAEEFIKAYLGVRP